ncbi:hypothetical protein RHSIM_Rhsim01G0076000 [Rhododendron simsii]|uniref:Reverse transcriptase zinc-binding domain-containing protein n=1 Tax=Rhododendron simsii TaxID=118357 RepID=A0A834HEN8_RHOSS|nr:hypothetical protein RHSIM_Rhsim01G0076000 [Rhododendron simsii]
MNNSLLKPFTSREIKPALFEMHPNKAPGYDGMTAGFFQQYWGIAGVDVCRAVRSFFHDGRMLRSVNRTQIVLIPKVQTPTKVSQFRPISLCTITDNVLIAHELTHYIKHKRSDSHGVAAFKLDMAKAYDRIEWSYLEMVMTQLGFHQIWIGWGCPLSPYLFLMCGEVQDCEALSWILDSYEAASGQKINKDKSSVFFSPNTPVQARNLLSTKDRTTKRLQSYKESKINHAGREIFKGRYFPCTSFWHANVSSQSSWAWKSIVWARKLIDKGWIWQVRSGKDIRVWEDPWLSKSTNFRINGTTPRREDIKKVADLIDSDTKSWKVSLIRETFNQEDADAILSIAISYTSQRDRKIWHPSPNGTFSVKSAYRLAKESSSSHHNLQEGQSSSSSVLPTVWKKLWGLSIHPKVKLFIWKCFNNEVATNLALVLRKVRADPVCSRCGKAEESIAHVLFQCEAAIKDSYAKQMTSKGRDDRNGGRPPEQVSGLRLVVSMGVEKLRQARGPCYFIADGAWDADTKRGATAWVRYGNGNVRITQDVTEVVVLLAGMVEALAGIDQHFRSKYASKLSDCLELVKRIRRPCQANPFLKPILLDFVALCSKLLHVKVVKVPGDNVKARATMNVG